MRKFQGLPSVTFILSQPAISVILTLSLTVQLFPRRWEARRAFGALRTCALDPRLRGDGEGGETTKAAGWRGRQVTVFVFFVFSICE
ncbi:hypothetical protein D6219_11580 [Coxiella burnetii]|nr:hypothetical protein D6219_11580 [Coxiella burnetii]PNT86575.1 hypothetical protein C2L93_02115 [Coxiella burnetii]RQM62568.1 hypothetical protein EHS23_01760 [Coxiella burnetii]RQM68522.1 hypothetical protein EHS22_01745 [Coxiella burnetii]RQM81405.1 hypothetical protein EHS20_02005 [Coxiella burnetii]